MPWGLALLVVSAGMFAQSTPPPPCPADRPVDEIVAEIQKQQSKKKNRNTNPLPESTCVFGWCLDHGRTPPTLPKSEPRAQTSEDDKASAADASSSNSNDPNSSSTSSTSSSRDPKVACENALEIAVSAAHNVEVGDYYFKEKNYRAAQQRYSEALEAKPSDAAIHVRLGRVLEKLNESPPAIEHYKAAQELGSPQKWADEAKAALSRLQPPST